MARSAGGRRSPGWRRVVGDQRAHCARSRAIPPPSMTAPRRKVPRRSALAGRQQSLRSIDKRSAHFAPRRAGSHLHNWLRCWQAWRARDLRALLPATRSRLASRLAAGPQPAPSAPRARRPSASSCRPARRPPPARRAGRGTGSSGTCRRVARVLRHAHREAEALDRQDLVDQRAVRAVEAHAALAPRPVVRAVRVAELGPLAGRRDAARGVAAPRPAAGAARVEGDDDPVALVGQLARCPGVPGPRGGRACPRRSARGAGRSRGRGSRRSGPRPRSRGCRA